MRLTVSDVRSSVARAASLATTDSTRIYDYINRAVRRLLPKGKWKSTYQTYRICAEDGCITWPRQIETIESYAVCGRPGLVQNQWYEFLPNGPGVSLSGSCVGGVLIDRGEHPAFSDISGIDKQIKVYTDVTESATAEILLQGYDENGTWIRTQVSGTWFDGEWVSLYNGPKTTTKNFSRLTGVQKPVTNGNVRLYSIDGDSTEVALAIYEPGETRPSYRRSYVPNMPTSSGGSCDSVQVDVMAKLRYIPVSNDQDWLIINNEPALESMVRGLRHFDNNKPEEGLKQEALAVKYLQEELMNFLGDGAIVNFKIQDRSVFGGGGIENPVAGPLLY